MNPNLWMSFIMSTFALINGWIYSYSGDMFTLIIQAICLASSIIYFYLGLTDIYIKDKLNKKE